MSCRNYCWTLYDYDLKDLKQKIGELKEFKYTVFQEEECPTTKKRHLQGYTEMTKTMKMTTFKKLIGRNDIHVEGRKGNRDEAREYCMKEKSRIGEIVEIGEWSKQSQGKRNDLIKISRLIDEGLRMSEIVKDEANRSSYIRYNKGLEKYKSIVEETRSWKTIVKIYWGDSGTGKTRKVVEESKDLYIKPKGEWWDGYEGQEDVLLDEFTGGDFKFTELLKILDRYAMKVPIKGGFVNFIPKRIFMTSNINPIEWYGDLKKEQQRALFRRIDEIIEFTHKEEKTKDIQRADKFIDLLNERLVTALHTQAKIDDNTLENKKHNKEENMEGVTGDEVVGNTRQPLKNLVPTENKNAKNAKITKLYINCDEGTNEDKERIMIIKMKGLESRINKKIIELEKEVSRFRRTLGNDAA